MSEHKCTWYCEPANEAHAFLFLLHNNLTHRPLKAIRDIFDSQREPYEIMSVREARESNKGDIMKSGAYVRNGVVVEWPTDFEKNHTAYVIMAKVREVKHIE